MTDSLIQRERAFLAEVARLAAERVPKEQAAAQGSEAARRAAETLLEEARQAFAARFQAEEEALQAEYAKADRDATERFEAERTTLTRALSAARRAAAVRFELAGRAALEAFEGNRRALGQELEVKKLRAEDRLRQLAANVSGYRDHLEAIRAETASFLGAWDDEPEPPAPASGRGAGKHALEPLKKAVALAAGELRQARRRPVLRLMRGYGFLQMLLFLLVVGPATAALLPWAPQPLTLPWYHWLGAGAVAGAVVCGILFAWYCAAAHGYQVRIREHYARAQALCLSCRAYLKASYQDLDAFVARARERHQHKLVLLGKRFHRAQRKRLWRRGAVWSRAAEVFDDRSAQAERRRREALAWKEEQYPRLLAEARQRYETGCRQAQESFDLHLAGVRERAAADGAELARWWQNGLARLEAEVADVNRRSRAFFPEWSDPAWQAWQPASTIPPAVRFGKFAVRMDQVPNGIPADERLAAVTPAGFTLPALVAFPDRCSLLFQARGEGLDQADLVLHAVMFRLLTALPPGKARFTIIDPVGLGRNFAAFMHLADYEESLVSGKVWSEQDEIDRRLADLTDHMAVVIQKYLRNQFATLEEYNRAAGEVAEPYWFVVVSRFPANFSAEAARRLCSLADGGARCGVHTLVLVDAGRPLPYGFALADLEAHAVCFTHHEGRFRWKDRDFGHLPFQFDPPPGPELATRVLQTVGEQAKRTHRVEVPFEFIAPPPDRWWAATSAAGIEVPLGRAGATRRQLLRLGQGTAQHALVAGKTGSGKSTLLHALITNTALLYSPDEVELYLIDFKEGVEFKAYATHELAHARVVAIESDREFGLSVLQRLEAELKTRADRFRALGVHDLPGYRQVGGAAPLPRILLVVDEFQMFFVEDDKVAQEAALVLDRLVRQGRAFGIHTLLSSQTLGGAQALARSTMGQMTVRIALQCNEADARLILSDENSAARLLSRPGEAVYNDVNGVADGNEFFQVVWLSEEQRDAHLRRLADLARQRPHAARPQIVFEGKAPADVARNEPLKQALAAPAWPAPPRSAVAWLGEAMAIKEPTAAVFRPQRGRNLILVGQFEEDARAVLAVALVGLAAQHPPGPPGPDTATRFYVLDGTPADDPHAGFWGRLRDTLPHPTRIADSRDLPAVVAELAAEVERRQGATEATPPLLFVFVYGLQRLRDLRAQEEDFSFSRRTDDQPPPPSKLFATVLRDGPAVGVFTLAWCDGLNNVNRTLERQGLREFEMRVLFQMSAADSSSLIDLQLANKLGPHRALFYTEDRGQPEKFRPYDLPSEAWLAAVREQLNHKPPGPTAGS